MKLTRDEDGIHEITDAEFSFDHSSVGLIVKMINARESINAFTTTAGWNWQGSAAKNWRTHNGRG